MSNLLQLRTRGDLHRYFGIRCDPPPSQRLNCQLLRLRVATDESDESVDFYLLLSQIYNEQIRDLVLIKGLSSRKVGATSIHSESSQCHIVFTCVIESWCKVVSRVVSSQLPHILQALPSAVEANNIQDKDQSNSKVIEYLYGIKTSYGNRSHRSTSRET
ncbi:Kinesin-like protein KIN-12B [Camellia lanceoleosa]|uniref:Kinesin-like protein KIN-12B n=1 Tax=Camellia lanceoleosa TaxID=1840588 RepID=A0ACC0FWI1_9ERIC|nr:Kinesin-like protein KIN-12B [Camellia lanceoleosa]